MRDISCDPRGFGQGICVADWQWDNGDGSTVLARRIAVLPIGKTLGRCSAPLPGRNRAGCGGGGGDTERAASEQARDQSLGERRLEA